LVVLLFDMADPTEREPQQTEAGTHFSLSRLISFFAFFDFIYYPL
jgi:hypothetical protein